MRRILRINKYKNVGIEDKVDVLLNSNYKEGSAGELVILVGENNSGKSNVLNALSDISQSKLYEDAITTLAFDEESQNPEVSLICSDANYKFEKKVDLKGVKFFVNNEEFRSFDFEKELKEFLKTANMEKINSLFTSVKFKNVLKTFKERINYEYYRRFCGHYEEFEQIKNLEEFVSNLQDTIENLCFERKFLQKVKNVFDNFFNEINVIYEKISKRIGRNSHMNNFIECADEKIIKKVNELLEEFLSNNDKLPSNFSQKKPKLDDKELEFKEKFGMDLNCDIIKFESSKIKNSDLNQSTKTYKNSAFFTNLLSMLSYGPTVIDRVIDNAKKRSSNSEVRNLENELTKKLGGISQKFNKLYCLDSDIYEFNIRLSVDELEFEIQKNGAFINYEIQSTGFKWFFDFFFSLNASNAFNKGDIILLDEPATNLSVTAVREFRDFLKEFAVKNDITIVLVTHSPFFINNDYLDELRVVRNNNNIVEVINYFTLVDELDADSLKGIKKALTVESNILISHKERIVFVEGITDYNYLVAMSKLVNAEKFVFLPINGVKKNSSKNINDERTAIIKTLNDFSYPKQLLLVDSDKAGNDFVEFASTLKTNLNIISLGDISTNLVDIESLFTKEERDELKKSSNSSKNFKYSVLNKRIEISEKTKENFTKLFNYLSDNI